MLGAGLAALQVFDAVSSTQVQAIMRLYDDVKAGSGVKFGGIGVAGPIDLDRIADDYRAGAFDAAVISTGDASARARIFEALVERGVPFANVIHSRASIGLAATIGAENVMMANVVIAARACVGDNNFVSAFCNFEHHSIIGSHNTFGPGIMLSGGAKIGSRTRLGTGVFLEPSVSVGSNGAVASGCVLTRRVPNDTLVLAKASYSYRAME
jgi:UDP-3-O-[3-hydroxymyristoyl] glucosamine N-acyltransferase